MRLSKRCVRGGTAGPVWAAATGLLVLGAAQAATNLAAPPLPPAMPTPAVRRASPPAMPPAPRPPAQPAPAPNQGPGFTVPIPYALPASPAPGPNYPVTPVVRTNSALPPGVRVINPTMPRLFGGNTNFGTNSPFRTAIISNTAPVTLPPLQQEKAFAWDALVKEYTAKTGELSAKFTFSLTNISEKDVIINGIRTSCGCTSAKVPALPWKLPPTTNGTFEVLADLRGKSGTLTKTITVDSSAGYRFLTVRVAIPAGTPATTAADRARNMQLSMADRQAVFKADCAVCHLTPALAKQGEDLYRAACGICHEAEHRASMVPNLHALAKPTDADYWRSWVREGKSTTLMPAWSKPQGGPLTDEQIDGLVQYLVKAFPNRTNAAPAAALSR